MPAGTFVMGSPPSEPFRGRTTEEQREVTLTHALLYDRHETTQAEWTAAGFVHHSGAEDNGSGGRDCVAADCPVGMITWFEAATYANARSRREGLSECVELIGCTGVVGESLQCQGVRQLNASYYDCDGYRLPTHAELEYATRAGTQTAFYSGPFEPASTDCVDVPHLSEAAWYCANAGNHTHPVCTRQTNAWGLCDMTGNASEFVASFPENDTTALTAATDPYSRLPSDATMGSGGGLYVGWAWISRSATRPLSFSILNPVRKAHSGPGLGFRLVRSVREKDAAAW